MFINFGFILMILSQTEKTGSVFVSVGDYSEESIPGLNSPECGLSALPIVHHLSFEKSYENNCFRNIYKNKTLVFFDIHNTPEKKPVLSRIHHGIEVRDATEAPWVVYIGTTQYFIQAGQCTGSLLTSEWIITAAHCFEDKKDKIGYESLSVAIGGLHKSGIRREFIPKAKFISNDLYVNPRLPGAYEEPKDEGTKEYIRAHNDIALIKIPDIKTLLRHDDRYLINTICLPKKHEVNAGFEDTVTAFGYGDWNNNFFGEVPDYLQKADILLDDYNRCERGKPGIPRLLCATINKTTPSTCQGDSGGPIVQFVGSGPEKRAVLVGTLRGSNAKNCISDKRSSWVPTSKHIDWILKTMKNN